MSTDIYSYLKKDHRKVNGLLDKILEIDDAKERLALFNEIKHELLLHAKTEEDSFYKALDAKKPSLEEKIEHAEDEHKEIEKYFKKLDTLKFNSEEWIEQFGEFRHSLKHHIENEEGEIFEKAKKVLSNRPLSKLIF